MHKCTRLATTAGATVLTFVALSGAAQADPLGDATDGLTDALGGVVDTVTGGAVRLSGSSPATSPSSTAHTSGSTNKSTDKSTSTPRGGDPLIGVRLDGPVHANTRVRANSSPGNGTQASVSVDAGVRQPLGHGDLLRASVNVGVDTCGFAPEVCGMVPPVVPPVTPPGTGRPPATPPGVTGPSGAGPGAPSTAAAVPSSMQEGLPLTGGPIGLLAGLGLAAVLTGSAAVAGSRLRVRREAD
jgi:hypothetical protein